METVTRHRFTDDDVYGGPGDESTSTIVVREVRPLVGRDVVRQRVGKHTRTFTCTLYTITPVDVRDGDEITVRGVRYQFVSVSEWRASGGAFRGMEILCGGGDG